MWASGFLATVFLTTSLLVAKVQSKELTLTVLHTNDVHSRFLQTNRYSGPCSETEAAENKCFGGFPRLHYKVKEIRSQLPNVVYLSGGDYFQGTVWYTLYKWNIVSKYVNILNHTAMALGNHEFDDGVEGLVPFLDAATFPVLNCNIDDRNEPDIQGKFQKSIVVEYENVKVGIIGYTTTETMAISATGKLLFNDEVESVRSEAERLNAQGVKILIAVGHAGYDVDMKIAKQVPLIDVVVGGHTNTFLFHGQHPDVEEPMDEYPTVITQTSGKQVPVVQAYAFGKYLGFLNVTFNEAGDVTGWAGNPILLDGSVPEDPEILEQLTKHYEDLKENLKNQVGKTHVFLNGTSAECRLRECNLGSLMADAMVWANLKFPDDLYWSDVTMAIMNGGGVRSSIDEKSNNGSITIEDVLTVMPFQNTIDLIEIKGKHLKEAYEFSVVGYDPKGNHLAGKFLQMSGIRVVYDISQPDGSRVKELLTLCSKCRVPRYEPIEPEQVYKVAAPTYIIGGGDGYTVLRDNIIQKHETNSDMLVEYIKIRSPIIQGVEGRIQFYSGPSESGTGAASGQQAWSLAVLLSLICVVLYS